MNASDGEIAVYINNSDGQAVHTETFRSGSENVFVEGILPADVFNNLPETNTFVFRLESPAGSTITFSNVLLWFPVQGKQTLGTNVKAAPFFARGDGVSNDTDAIQKAIEYVWAKRGGGTLLFPAGEYVIYAPGLVIPRGGYDKRLIFRGEGRSATLLSGGSGDHRLDSYTPLIRYDDDSNQHAYNHIWEDMTIERGNPGPVFVHAHSHSDLEQRAIGCVFRNIEFRSLSRIRIKLDNDNNKLDNDNNTVSINDIIINYTDFFTALDEGQVPDNLDNLLHLEDLFPKLGEQIPTREAYVEVEQLGCRWTIVDVKPEENEATEYVIRKFIPLPIDANHQPELNVHLGTGLMFSLERLYINTWIKVLDTVGLLAISCFFRAHDITLTNNATFEVQQTGKKWKIIDSFKVYIIQKADQTLNVFQDDDKIFGIGFDELIYEIDKEKVSGVLCLFESHGQILSENAIIKVIKTGNRWKVLDLGKEYVIWKVDDRLYVYLSRAATRIEGMLNCVLDTVSINGGVTALRLEGSHFTTINLHTTDDHSQVNAIDVDGRNATMISTRIEACEGGYGLRLNNSHNVVLEGIWFEGKRTHPRIEIMDGSYGITILNPALAQPSMEHIIGLLVHRGVSNVRVIGGVTGNFKDTHGCYALKVENGARQIHIERLDGLLGMSSNGSFGKACWVEEGAYDVVIEANINGAKGDQIVYKAGLIWSATNYEGNTSPDFRIDNFDIFNVEYEVVGDIKRIVYGGEPSGYEGQIIRLLFKNGNATVKSCEGNIRLSDNAHFDSHEGDTLSLICNGKDEWFEIGRSRGCKCPPTNYPPIPQDNVLPDWLSWVIGPINDWLRDLKDRLRGLLRRL
ncbi:MAG: glycosyl hydrolase family 28-related protein [Saprospiraceae bacterium]